MDNLTKKIEEKTSSGVEMIYTPIVFRNLKPTEIECRAQATYEKSQKILLYKNARVDMNILDETVGCFNWQRRHEEIKGNLFCGVGIKQGDGEWTWKYDCGTESNTEKEKGEASDAFKRACVCWGIGRELYTAPTISITLTDEDYFKGKVCQTFSVKDIDINSNKEITYLCITDRRGNVRFEWGEHKPSMTSKQKREILNRLANGEDLWEKIREYYSFDEPALRAELKERLEKEGK